MCLALVCGLVAWVVSIAALLIHKPKILFPAAVLHGLQGMYITDTLAHVCFADN